MVIINMSGEGWLRWFWSPHGAAEREITMKSDNLRSAASASDASIAAEMVFHSPGRITIGDPMIEPPRLPLGFDDPYSHGYTERSAGIHVSYSASGDLIGGFRVFDCDLVVTQQVYDLLISKVADLRRRAIEHEYPAFSAWANELEGRLITVSAPA